MEDNFENLFRDIKNTKLTDSERAFMRNNLEFFVAEYPAHAPISVRITDAISHWVSMSGARRQYVTSAGFAFVLMLTVGAGTSFAAAEALPGDTLYSVKLKVNESVEGALALGTEAKVKLQSKKMARRLEEAEALAAAGRLTSATRSIIESEINKSANDFDARVAVLAKMDGQAVVAEVQSDLEATLVGHAGVIASLSTDLPESRPVLSRILATVQVRAKMSQTARTDAEDALAVGEEDTVRVAALEKKSDANSAVNRVRSKTRVPRPSPTAAAALKAEASTSNAMSVEQAIMAGELEFEQGEYGAAFSTFQAVIRAAQSAEVQLDAEERLNTDVVASSSTVTAEFETTSEEDEQ